MASFCRPIDPSHLAGIATAAAAAAAALKIHCARHHTDPLHTARVLAKFTKPISLVVCSLERLSTKQFAVVVYVVDPSGLY